MKLYFVSDLHLRNPEDEKCQALLVFLRSLREAAHCEHLFLVGDIFDLWVSNHHYFIQRWQKLVSELVRLKLMGVKIHIFEGNHDLYLSDYFAQHLGLNVYSGPTYFELGSKVFRVEHGDQMDPTDRGYLFLRWFLRTPTIRWAIKNLKESFIVALGDWASRKSRIYTSNTKVIGSERGRQVTLAHAKKVYAEGHFDFLICGHTHIPVDEVLDFGQGPVRVINLGFQANPTALSID